MDCEMWSLLWSSQGAEEAGWELSRKGVEEGWPGGGEQGRRELCRNLTRGHGLKQDGR